MSNTSRWKDLNLQLPDGVNLLAVSKGYPSISIRCLAELGQLDFGESRLQEALPKIDALNDIEFLRWHFIGRLQANKVRNVVKKFQYIHSVDSFNLAERISRISGEEKCCPKIMLQVKFREDPNKGGFAPRELVEVFPDLFDLPNIKINGLMTMCPQKLESCTPQMIFEDCRDLADRLGLVDCSMGMSGDWQEAVKAGTTWIRLGTSLFGTRNETPTS